MAKPMLLQVDEILPKGPLFKFLSLTPRQEPPWQERLQQILEGKAYHPSPRQFNDPFDCLPRITLPTSMEEIRANQELLVRRFVKHVPGYAPDEIARMVTEALGKMSLQDLSDRVIQTVQVANEGMGVFSLAETINNVLMWSHYASNHTGIAIRFDWRKQLRGGLMPLFKVRYQKDRPSILNFFDSKFAEDDDIIFDALRTKAGFWEYEQEWRSIQPNMAGQIVEFDPAIVDGVVLGAKCSSEDERLIRTIVSSKSLPVMRAFANADTYDLDFKAREGDLTAMMSRAPYFPIG